MKTAVTTLIPVIARETLRLLLNSIAWTSDQIPPFLAHRPREWARVDGVALDFEKNIDDLSHQALRPVVDQLLYQMPEKWRAFAAIHSMIYGISSGAEDDQSAVSVVLEKRGDLFSFVIGYVP